MLPGEHHTVTSEKKCIEISALLITLLQYLRKVITILIIYHRDDSFDIIQYYFRLQYYKQ